MTTTTATEFPTETPLTPPELVFMKAYAVDPDDGVRYRLALNPRTPASVLMLLVEDKYHYVRSAVAKHHNAPPEALKVLAKDPNDYARSFVAGNLNSTPQTLTPLVLEEKNFFVRQAAAGNPNLAKSTQVKLARMEMARMEKARLDGEGDRDKGVIIALSKNPSLTFEAAKIMKFSHIKAVRENLVDHLGAFPQPKKRVATVATPASNEDELDEALLLSLIQKAMNTATIKSDVLRSVLADVLIESE